MTTSRFYMALGYFNNGTCDFTGTVKSSYDKMKEGGIQGSFAVVGIYDKTNVAPDLQTPKKRVSKNANGSYGTSLTLNSITGEYYYSIDYTVLDTIPAYHFSSMSFNDTLPAGVDYVSDIKVTRLEDGSNKTSWFSASTSGDKIVVSATSGALSNNDFYGYTYRLTFKVQMDPSEIDPSYDGNGNATYTVNNTASVSVNRGGVTTRNTNTVSTSASVNRVTHGNPYKRVAGDKTTQKIKRTDTITFSIYQDIAASPKAVAPTNIVLKDTLENCLEYKSSKVYYISNGAWVQNNNFSASANGQTITVQHKGGHFTAGTTWRFDITCKVKDGAHLDNYVKKLSDGKNYYVIPNKGNVTLTFPAGPNVSKDTNEVTVYMELDEVNVYVNKTNADTGENIANAEFTVYEWNGSSYANNKGTMEYTARTQRYQMLHLEKTSTNAGKYKIVETVTPSGHTGAWEQEFVVGTEQNITFNATNPMSTGTITVYKKSYKGEFLSGAVFQIKAKDNITSPQGKVLVNAGTLVDTVTTGSDGKAVSKKLYPGNYTVTETNAPLGYSLNKTPQNATVVYKDKNTPVTNVDVTFVNDRLYSTIKITKEIDTADIVWPHGNPTFTFKVTGKDVLGVSHTYYSTVEFTKNNAGSGSKAALTATMKVLAGTYTVSEEKTVRYRFGSIHSVTNGTISGQTAILNVEGSKKGTEVDGPTGTATFYNIKSNDEDLTGTAFVRNTIV